MNQEEFSAALDNANAEIETLKTRIEQLEKSKATNISLPITNLLSDKFLTRAFAVYGHMLVAGLIIAIPIYIIAFIIGIAASGF